MDKLQKNEYTLLDVVSEVRVVRHSDCALNFLHKVVDIYMIFFYEILI